MCWQDIEIARQSRTVLVYANIPALTFTKVLERDKRRLCWVFPYAVTGTTFCTFGPNPDINRPVPFGGGTAINFSQFGSLSWDDVWLFNDTAAIVALIATSVLDIDDYDAFMANLRRK